MQTPTLTHCSLAGTAAWEPALAAYSEAEGQKIPEGIPWFIRCMYNSIVFLRTEQIKSLYIVRLIWTIVSVVCWWPAADLASLLCPEFISSDKSSRTTSPKFMRSCKTFARYSQHIFFSPFDLLFFSNYFSIHTLCL